MKQSFADNANVTDVEGRRLTFLANSGTRMVNGLTVDLDTLKVPVSDGSLKLVKDLSDDDKLTVPLLVDHMPSVEYQAGTVTKLWRDDNGLMAEASLSHVDMGERIRQLAADNALTNSFSITVDYGTTPGKDGVIRDAELVEISVVYRGADSKAAFQSLNERNTMDNKFKMSGVDEAVDSFALSQEDKDKLKSAVQSAMESAVSEIMDAMDSDDTEDAPMEPEQPNQSANERKTVQNTIIINKANKNVGGSVAHTKERASWLDSHDAFNQFERILLEHDGEKPEAVHDAWVEYATEKLGRESFDASVAETDVTKFIPTEAITTVEDALNTYGSGIWGMLRKTGLDRLTIGGANIGVGLDDNTRAHGYKHGTDYGNAKTKGKDTFVKRSIEADYVYKYMTLNKGDIRRTQRPGALLSYLLSEIPNYIIQTIERQIVLGSYSDMDFLRAIITDMNDSSGDWQGKKFATKMTPTAGDPLLYDFVRASHKVKAQGTKVLVCSSDTVTEMLLAQDSSGRTLIDLGDEGLARRIGVSQIITPEWWTSTDDATTKGVVFVPAAYSLVGDSSIEAFTNFALSTNTNEYLQEIFVGGALAKQNAAAVVSAS